jgi:hypothetical protein
VRRGFLADHSSTSYEFLAVDRPLDAKARAAVARLSRRARPTPRRVSFVYHPEGYDLPGGWEPLMARYYDVMYSESYDWWTLVVAFDTQDKQLLAKLKKYVSTGSDDLGVSVSGRAGRMAEGGTRACARRQPSRDTSFRGLRPRRDAQRSEGLARRPGDNSAPPKREDARPDPPGYRPRPWPDRSTTLRSRSGFAASY